MEPEQQAITHETPPAPSPAVNQRGQAAGAYQPKKGSAMKIIVITLVVMILGAASVFGWYWYQENYVLDTAEPTPLPEEIAEQTPEPTAEATTPPEPAAQTKLHVSVNNFSFAYPGRFEAVEKAEGKVSILEGNLETELLAVKVEVVNLEANEAELIRNLLVANPSAETYSDGKRDWSMLVSRNISGLSKVEAETVEKDKLYQLKFESKESRLKEQGISFGGVVRQILASFEMLGEAIESEL